MIDKTIGNASVLSFNKKLTPSDGFLHGTNWESRHSTSTPLVVQEKSVKGTISNRFNKKDKASFKDDPAKLDAKVESANLQTIDACALGENQDTLKMAFSLKVLSGVETPSACNNTAFAESLGVAVNTYKEKYGFLELGLRYATNIANARFLWRNRIGCEQIEVIVSIKVDGKDVAYTFDSASLSTRNFNHGNKDIKALGVWIAKALSGDIEFLNINIVAFAQINTGQDVYPSEELVLDKGKGDKSKVLYRVNGFAGMHSQKIGNALRSIDTWFPDYDENKTGPIAVEPYGAVTNSGTAYRHPSLKADFYTLFDAFARGGELATPEEYHFVIATLIRGGVFGESAK
jgi:CRISPR-associated protein Csy3